MGTLAKGLAFILGLALLGLGGWAISIPLFIYSFWGIIFRPSRPRESYRGLQDRYRSPQDNPKREGIRKTTFAGIVLLIISAIAITQGGQFSVLVLGGAGLLLVLWGRLPRFLLISTVRPVKESILTQSTLIPFYWMAMAEVKPLTKNVAGILSSIDEPMIIDASKSASIYVLSVVFALNRSSAIQKANSKLRDLGLVLSPLDGYIVPLDSWDAASFFRSPLRNLKIDKENWRHSVQTLPYDVVALCPKGGFLESIGLFMKSAEKKAGTRTIRPTAKISVPPLTWEAVKAFEGRVQWPEPDDITGFAASLSAKRGQPAALKLPSGNYVGDIIQTRTFSGRGVQLKPSQLRALVSVYE
jgi:hypothetical protein